MTTGHLTRCTRACSRQGLTLVEMVISMVLVGVLLVAALNMVGASKHSQQKATQGHRGHLLAQSLLNEILRQDYADPVDGPDSFGLSAAEAATGDRSLFDDVDDYDQWQSDPPQHKDGTAMNQLLDWKRKVDVRWVDPNDISQNLSDNQGVKEVTVEVSHNGVLISELQAIKTIGLPPPVDDDNPKLLFVVVDISTPTAQELARKVLMESWGFTVTLIADSDTQANFDAAVAVHHVAYVSNQIVAAQLADKLAAATIGVVNENADQAITLGFVDAVTENPNRRGLYVLDNMHYVTSPFSLGALYLFTGYQTELYMSGSLAPGIQSLGHEANDPLSAPVLAVLKTDAQLWDSGTAAGRRVQLPWPNPNMALSELSDNAQTIMKRAIEWAAETAGGGDEPVEMYCNDIAMGWRKQGNKYYGQATVWIKDDGGANVSGATVTVQWSGSVSGSNQGVTGPDGKIMLESSSFATGGGTFTATVTDVVRSGDTYNASLNVETSDSITAP